MRRAATASLFAAVVGVALTFGSSVVVARVAGPSGKGAYDLAMASASLLALILGLALQGAMTYAIARGDASPAGLVWPSVAFAGAQALLAVLALLVLRVAGTGVAVAVALLVGVTNLAGYFRAMLVGSNRIERASLLEIFGRAMILAALLIAAGLARAPGFEVLLWATVLGGLVALFASWMGLRVVLVEGPKRRASRVLAGFALPTYLGNVIQFLNYRLDLFLVGLFAGLAGVGVYALAVSLGQLIWLLTNPLAVVLLPRVASGNTRGVTDVARACRITLLGSVTAAVALAIAARMLIAPIFGAGFSGAWDQLVILLPGIAGFGLVNVLAAYLGGRGRPDLNLSVALIALAVTLALDVYLIPRYGGLGAALATTLSYSLSTVLTVVAAVRLGELRLLDIVIPRRGDLTAIVGVLRRPDATLH